MKKSDRFARFLADASARVKAGAYACDGPALASNGPLATALRRDDAVIAELKPRSPSEGRLLMTSPLSVLEAYKDGGAAALSILTDADHFDGDPGLLRAAHATGLPTMMKDFVVTEDQILCAAHQGASAVLLIERCFDDPDDRERLVRAAHGRGLEVLLELFDAADLERAKDSAADLFGVNARDLDTLDVDMASSHALIRSAATSKPTVALSGIRRRSDLLAARLAGATAVLVGTSLLKAPSPCLAVAGLRRPLAKVCGITDEESLRAAESAGADLVGFVVGADSPRNLDIARARALVEAAHVPSILVTPHDDAAEVRAWCEEMRPDFVQLHRLRPDDDWIASLRDIGVHVLHAGSPDIAPGSGAGFVVDTPHPPGGGSGTVHDWDATARLIADDPRLSLVAGGLAADNAAAAVEATGAWGADASSRLESAPGHKDPQAVADYVAAVHGGIA